MDSVQFYRGPFANYNDETHKNCVYFATDKRVIIMNGVLYNSVNISDFDGYIKDLSVSGTTLSYKKNVEGEWNETTVELIQAADGSINLSTENGGTSISVNIKPSDENSDGLKLDGENGLYVAFDKTNEAIQANANMISTLNGGEDEDGSVKKTVKESVDALKKTFRYGCTNVTTLANLPIKTRLVYASISSDENLTVDTTTYSDLFAEFPDGVDMKVIAYNNSSKTVTINLPWKESNNKCFVKTLTLKCREYGVITIDFKSQTDVFFNGSVESIKVGYVGEYGIVALSNGEDYQFIEDKDTALSDFKTQSPDYEPIGIVVIPASCSNIIYPQNDVRNGKNIIMSFAPMSYTTPDTGGSVKQNIDWGSTTEVSGLTNYSELNYYTELATQTTIGVTTWGRMPSDAFSGAECKQYSQLKYNEASESQPVPSPFKMINGELIPNEDYYTTRLTSSNALSDFAGPNNTKLLVDSATSQSDWKTKGTSITNSYNAGYYPAACCCARYGSPDNSTAPKGTCSFLKHYTDNSNYDYSMGVTNVWYMPACGELGFIIPNRVKNDSTMEKVKNLYSLTNVASLGSSGFWSSTESSDKYARVMKTSDGTVGDDFKQYGFCVYAFCAV